MKVKKLLAILLTLSLAAGLTACGGLSEEETESVSNIFFAESEQTEAQVSEPTAAPAPSATETPVPEVTKTPAPEPKTTIAIAELAEGTYTGTLSGDSYSGTYDDCAYSISPEISPAEMTVTIQAGEAALYCEAEASAEGTVFGVDAPRSPAYTQTLSGKLPRSQLDDATVSAEGDITTPSESTYIYWDGDHQFDRWEIITKDGTHHCTVSITMVDGVPTAEIVVDGSKSHRTATVALALY